MIISINLDSVILHIATEVLIETINTLDVDKNITGFKFNISRIDNDIRSYLLKIASLCKNYNYTIMIYNINLDMDIKEHMKYLMLYNNISKILDKKVNIIYNSCLKYDLKHSILDTISNYTAIVGYVIDNKLNLSICAENLEYINRPDFKSIVNDITSKVYALNISYNIGKEAFIGYNSYDIANIADVDTDVLPSVINKIKNISIHDNDLLSSNLPFVYGNIDLYEVKEFINTYRYDKDITIDLDMYKLSGESLKEKLTSYVSEVNKVIYMLK